MNGNSSKASKIAMYTLMFFAMIIVALPLLYAFAGSFKSSVEFRTGSTGLLPSVWRWQNYTDAWELANFSRFTLNSVLLSIGTVIGTVLSTTMAGYALSRSKMIIRKPLEMSFAITLFVSGTITLFPIYQLCNSLKLVSSLWGMTLAQIGVSQPIYCILVIGYVNGISKEIDEAARLDGCSFFRTYWNIILPVITPIIASVAILSFRDAWNNYMMPLAFTLSKPMLRTLTVGVVLLKDQGEGISSWNLMIAGTCMSLVPMILVYIFLNRYFIAGMMDGAVKG